MGKFGVHFDQQDYLYGSELKPVHKEGVGYGIDEGPAWLELSEALEAKEYKLLRLERLEPVEAEILLLKFKMPSLAAANRAPQRTRCVFRLVRVLEGPKRKNYLDRKYKLW